MDFLDNHVREYTRQLREGHIQNAYKGIMVFLSDLRVYLRKKYPDHTVNALYFGYMDMSYFSFTPDALIDKKLRIAIVFLHEECRFEVWLVGNNRHIQADYIKSLAHKDIGEYTLSQIGPGVDSIISSIIVAQPDFDNPAELMKKIEGNTIKFIEDIYSIIGIGR